MKTCNKCGESKDVSDFHRNKKMPDGYQYTCKACTKLWYEMTNGANTNCRTLRNDLRALEHAPGALRRGMNGQREISRLGIVGPHLMLFGCSTLAARL